MWEFRAATTAGSTSSTFEIDVWLEGPQFFFPGIDTTVNRYVRVCLRIFIFIRDSVEIFTVE